MDKEEFRVAAFLYLGRRLLNIQNSISISELFNV
jgi:hypothetical protein